jgi:hypothetical protein
MRGGVAVADPFRPEYIGVDLTHHKDKEGMEILLWAESFWLCLLMFEY